MLKIKDFFNINSEENSKKKIENLVFFLVLLIITILVINIILKGKSTTNNNEQTNTQQLAVETNVVENNFQSSDLEKKLENILSSINGVGKVNVFINYSETSKTVAMYNENTKQSSTEETDTSGGVRTIQETDTQKEVVYNEIDGNKIPITEKIVMPTIEGAIITAEGASNATIKTNIVEAVEAATGLSTHKIQVFESNK